MKVSDDTDNKDPKLTSRRRSVTNTEEGRKPARRSLCSSETGFPSTVPLLSSISAFQTPTSIPEYLFDQLPASNPARRQLYLQKILEDLVSALGGKPEPYAIAAILSLIQNNISSPLSNSQFSVLSGVVEKVHKLMDSEKSLSSLVTVQSHIRRRRVQIAYSSLRKRDPYALLKFHEICRELFATENSYLDKLTSLIKDYCVPAQMLVGNDRGHIKQQDFAALFSNVTDIHAVHWLLHEQIQTLISKWPFIQELPDIILNILPRFKVYGEYVSQYKCSINTLSRLMNENTKFGHLIEEAVKQGKPDLHSLLSTPIAHICCYKEMFNSLAEIAGVDWSEWEGLNRAATTLKETWESVQFFYEQSENNYQVLNVERRLKSGSRIAEIFKGSNREYVKEMPMKTSDGTFSSRKKKGSFHNFYLFVFTDLLLITKEVSRDSFSLRLSIKIDSSTTLSEPLELPQKQFGCRVRREDQFVIFVFKTLDDYTRLFALLQKLIDRKTKLKVFGEDLAKLVEREDSDGGIPTFLRKSCEYIRKTGIDKEGLFRVSGNDQQMALIKEAADNGKSDTLDFDNFSIHSICGAIKQYFRELPQPLISSSLYDQLLDIQRNEANEELRIQKLLAVLEGGESEIQLKLLRYLMGFLEEVSRHSEKNKMIASNLAIVFAPSILRPAEKSVETSLSLPVAHDVVWTLIENFTTLPVPVPPVVVPPVVVPPKHPKHAPPIRSSSASQMPPHENSDYELSRSI